MIRGLLNIGGKKIVVIGLSGENMARLMNNEPILFNLTELALPDQQILLIGGKDEITMSENIMTSLATAVEEA